MQFRTFQIWVLCAGTFCLLAASGCASTGAGAAGAAAPVAPPTSATAGGQTIIAISPPPLPQLPQPNLVDFLGLKQIGGFIDQTFRGIGRVVGGLFPKLTTSLASLEPPPLPARVVRSGEHGRGSPPRRHQPPPRSKHKKTQPDKRFNRSNISASLGCNSKYPEIEEGFLESLNDPTEEVRLQAAIALRSSSSGACKTCQSSSCCSPRIRAVLDRIANEYDETGCPYEPSAQVRREARLALRKCGGPGPPLEQEPPIEGPIPAQEELPITHVQELPPVNQSFAGGRRSTKTVSLADVLSSSENLREEQQQPEQILTISFEELESTADAPQRRDSIKRLLNE